MADGASIGVATLAITQGLAQFNVFLPRISEVRKAAPGDDVSADVHVGEIAAIAGTVGVGLITSSLTGSKLPVVVSVIVCVLMVLVYESVLRSTPERFAF